MTKQIKVIIDNIKKAKDKKFIDEICNNILESLNDWEKEATKIYFEKDTNTFIVKFNLRVSKTGDLLSVLIREWLNLCIETEPNLFISINEVEEHSERGVTYKIFSYIPEK
jgi:hypothetical protein